MELMTALRKVVPESEQNSHVLEDPIKKKVDALFKKVDPRLELEIVEFSAKGYHEDHIYKKVVKALQSFFIRDKDLLERGVN